MTPLADMTLDVVSFIAGGHRFGVEAGCVRRQVAGDYPGAVPVETLLGMANDAYSEFGFQQVLLIKQRGADLALLVSEPVQLHCLASAAIHPVPPLVAAYASVKRMRGLAVTPQGIIALVDLDDPPSLYAQPG